MSAHSAEKLARTRVTLTATEFQKVMAYKPKLEECRRALALVQQENKSLKSEKAELAKKVRLYTRIIRANSGRRGRTP